MRSLIRALAVLGLAVGLISASAPAYGAVVQGSFASAFGIRAHVTLLGATAINVPPTPSAVAPDSTSTTPNNVARQIVGNIRIPADGSLIGSIDVLSVKAKRTTGALLTARGEALVTGVSLLEQAGSPLISAEVIKAVSDTRCTSPTAATASGEGSTLVGLKIGPQIFNAVPPPNTRIPLTSDGGTPADPTDDRGIVVILNEQTGATAGAGLIVTMVHVLVYDALSPNLIFADIRIAEAKSTVFCSLGVPPTNNNGDNRGVVSDKVVRSTTSDVLGATDGSEATVHRSEKVTWTITLTNRGSTGCGLVVVSDTLPLSFTFESSSGDLTEVVTPTTDGQRIVWSNPGRYSLPAGGTLTETIVATVAADAPFGTYTNLVDVEQSTCSSFTQGLRGPVTVIPRPSVLASRPRPAPLPATGEAPLGLVAAGLLLTVTGALARTASGRPRFR